VPIAPRESPRTHPAPRKAALPRASTTPRVAGPSITAPMAVRRWATRPRAGGHSITARREERRGWKNEDGGTAVCSFILRPQSFERTLPKVKAKTPSQKQLDAWLREWQRILRLQDWEVKVAARRERAMHSDECEGCNRYQPELKRASIHIRDPLDDPEDADFPPDPETTIVHELLHLHFAPFYVTKGLLNTLQEQAIEAIAQSLVGLKRRGKAIVNKWSRIPPPVKQKPAAKQPPRTDKRAAGPARSPGVHRRVTAKLPTAEPRAMAAPRLISAVPMAAKRIRRATSKSEGG